MSIFTLCIFPTCLFLNCTEAKQSSCFYKRLLYLNVFSLFTMATPSETSPLIETSPPQRKHSRCCSNHVRYRLPRIEEKGAIVVIICNVLILSSLFAQFQEHYFTSNSLSIALFLTAVITFPIAGIVADTCVGRFKVIQESVALLTASSLLNIVLIPLQDYFTTTTAITLALLVQGLCCVGGSCYFACALPFIGDQLIGASGEQLSFAIYWIMWGLAIAFHTILLSFIPLRSLKFVAPTVALLCVSTMAFILCYWKGSLNTIPQLTNPYKLIFNVLHYSWKHKYPERRSALTYWEEDIPSRIDLGKSKYGTGGPFTVEEVEDVKTVFRLLPVIICAGGCLVGFYLG